MNNLALQRSQPEVGAYTSARLSGENQRFHGTGGVSPNNRNQGFRPAFLDSATGRVYASRFANGTPAPLHLLDGLPEDIVIRRNAEGAIIAVKETIIAGFVFLQKFYTREQAAEIMAAQ